MNYIISVINPIGDAVMHDICKKLELSVSLSLPGRGTAPKKIMDILGIGSREKKIYFLTATEIQTKELINQQRRRLYIDAPGNGITLSVPIKSVGGASTLSYLNNGEKNEKKMPEINYDYELVIAIANEGHNDEVMDAAREAGAGGGTVIHAKGTGGREDGKFFKVSIANEKEIIIIVAKSSEKKAIMTSIINKAGIDTPAGAITFSLPVSAVAGFGGIEKTDD